MLESLIRFLFLSLIIGFFFFNAWLVIDEFGQDSVRELEQLSARVGLLNASFTDFDLMGGGGVVECEPRLLNNVPGVVCFAQESVLND